jgi:hypothetical protein
MKAKDIIEGIRIIPGVTRDVIGAALMLVGGNIASKEERIDCVRFLAREDDQFICSKEEFQLIHDTLDRMGISLDKVTRDMREPRIQL